MNNEPVETGSEIEGRMSFKSSSKRNSNLSEANIHYRIKPQEVTFYQRMADYFWRQGLIKDPSLHLLGRACLNIVANKWAKLEEQNYNAYMSRRLAEARADAGAIPGREMFNSRARRVQTPFDETSYPHAYRSQPQRKVPPQLRRDPPIGRIEEDFW